MFDFHCHWGGKVCAQAFIEEEVKYCGGQLGENRIILMKKCPYDKTKEVPKKQTRHGR